MTLYPLARTQTTFCISYRLAAQPTRMDLVSKLHLLITQYLYISYSDMLKPSLEWCWYECSLYVAGDSVKRNSPHSLLQLFARMTWHSGTWKQGKGQYLHIFWSNPCESLGTGRTNSILYKIKLPCVTEFLLRCFAEKLTDRICLAGWLIVKQFASILIGFKIWKRQKE